MINSSICTIGDEILIGQIVDTNSSHFAQALNGIGVRVTRMVSFGDDRQAIISGLERELKENRIVIVTGGLGPTKVNAAQADVPDTCEVIPNRLGTAPIMVFRFDAGRFGHSCTLYSLPGVPFEALGAIPDIIDDIRKHYPTDDICHKTVMTYGLAESQLAKLIEPWENALPENIRLAYLPNPLTGVRLRLSIYGGEKAQEDMQIGQQLESLRRSLWFPVLSQDSTLQENSQLMCRKRGVRETVISSR